MRKFISERLLEERLRLGFNKGGMAKAGGIANSTYANYEDGNRSPDGEFLASIADAGADVNYILTGVRVTTIEPMDRTVRIAVELLNGMSKKQREMALSLLFAEKPANTTLENRNFG